VRVSVREVRVSVRGVRVSVRGICAESAVTESELGISTAPIRNTSKNRSKQSSLKKDNFQK
jgi:hypothetical protein